MEHPSVTGHYTTASNTSFSIVESEGRIWLSQPAIPDEYSPELVWVGPTELKITSGPVAGGVIAVEASEGVALGGLLNGSLPVTHVEDPPGFTPGEGLTAPEYHDDPERDRRFEEAWDAHQEGSALTAPDPYAVHELVQWLMYRDEFIFHGSGKADIEVFEPRRSSVELMNYAGHGNLGAVYGTHNGLWSMFFAVVDRDRLRGSIRNGFASYVSRVTGESADLYQFSVSETSLPDRPYSAGAVYVLPRDTFERIRFGGDGPYTNEWGSTERVKPLAVIHVEPEDFPFLEDIGGHDDGELMRLQEIADEVFGNVESVTRIDQGFRLTLSGDVDRAVLEEWLDLGRKFFPDMTRDIVDERTVEMTGPPALVHSLEERLAEFLEPD